MRDELGIHTSVPCLYEWLNNGLINLFQLILTNPILQYRMSELRAVEWLLSYSSNCQIHCHISSECQTNLKLLLLKISPTLSQTLLLNLQAATLFFQLNRERVPCTCEVIVTLVRIHYLHQAGVQINIESLESKKPVFQLFDFLL